MSQNYQPYQASMLALGQAPSVIRETFEYGNRRAAEIGRENVFDFSLGNPSVPAPDSVHDTMRRLMDETDSVLLHGYTSAVGAEPTRSAIAADINKRFSAGISAGNIYMTCGAAASLTVTLHAVLCPGDTCITFAPFFPEYRVFVEAANAHLTVVPADLDSFQLNLDAFAQLVNSETKAVIINTPNNPTGVVYTEENLRKLCEILRAKEAEYGHPIYLIADEPYRELVYDAETVVPYLPNLYDDCFVCYSYSKSLSLPGERIGYIAVNPRATDADVIAVICGQISRGIGHNCPPSIIQLAVSRVLNETSDLSVYETNMNLLYHKLVELGFTVVKPGGTFYIFPKALEDDANAFCMKAKKYDLILVPADNFGCPGYFRMAYCIDTQKVRRSLDVLEKFVREEYKS